MSVQGLICADCGVTVVRTGAMQKYCRPCSEKRHVQTKRRYANGAFKREKPVLQEIGAAASREVAASIFVPRPMPELHWQIRVAIPFSYAASKNHIYAMRSQGHVRLREESTVLRDLLALRVRESLARDPAIKVFHNKLWLDIHVQKSNHKGDAVNVVDLVCDGVKRAVPVDDRWFSIRFLDWEVVRKDPMIFVGIGQDATCDAQVCCYCGQIKPLTEYQKSRHNHLGVGRECKDCLANLSAHKRELREQKKRKGEDDLFVRFTA